MKIQDNDALVTPVFFLHPVKNEVETKKQGRPIFDDVEHVRIKLAANKQSVLVAPAHEIFTREMDPATGEQREMTYAMKYNAQYLAFKSGASQTNSGTPLEALPFLTPGKRLELKALNINTAEALASVGGQGLKNLGMGGRELQRLAEEYIANSADGAGDDALVSTIAAQDQRIAELEARLAAFDHDGDGKAGGAADDDGEADPKSPFAEWEDADIRNWLAEAAPDMTVDKRWGKKTLVTKADEVNATLAKKNGLKAN